MAVETAADETVEVAGLAVDAERRVGKGKLTLLTYPDPDAAPN